MRFFSRQGSGLQLCLANFGIRGARAALTFTGSLTGLTAGAPFDVTWSGAVGTSTLTLLSGTRVVNKIAFGISDESLLWSPYAFTPAGTYVLQLEDTSGQIATSSEFSMLAAGTNPSSTPMHFTNTEFDITAGVPFNVTWEGAKGITTLSLQQGDANSIKTTDVVLTDMINEYVVWTPYATTRPGQYILRLDDSSNDFAYGLVFNMQSAGSDSSLAYISSVSSSKLTQTQAPVLENPSTVTTPSTSNTLSSTAKVDTSKSSITGTSPATEIATPTNSASTSTGTNSNSATQTPDTSSSNSQNSSSPSATSKSTLSTGAKAGIGIACSLAFIFLLTTVFLLYRQWRSSPRDVTEIPGSSSAGSLGNKGAVEYFGNIGVAEKASEEAVRPAEVWGEGRVQELDGYGGRGVV